MSCDLAVLLFQAHANYGTWSIDFYWLDYEISNQLDSSSLKHQVIVCSAFIQNRTGSWGLTLTLYFNLYYIFILHSLDNWNYVKSYNKRGMIT